MARGKQFAQVPRSLLTLLAQRRINHRQVSVAVAILMCHDPRKPERCFPGIKRIAADTGIAARHVREDIDILEAVGFLTVDRKRGRVNHYQVSTAMVRTSIPKVSTEIVRTFDPDENAEVSTATVLLSDHTYSEPRAAPEANVIILRLPPLPLPRRPPADDAWRWRWDTDTKAVAGR